MKKSLFILLAGLACIMMIAAGCTSTSGTAPATTPATTAAPAATTAPATPSAPAAEATIVVSSPAPSWSGTWNTTYTSADSKPVTEVLVLNQTGSSVTGTYGKNSTGMIAATAAENKLTGNWSESDPTGNYSGMFAFVWSADEKSFTGRWIDANESVDSLAKSNLTWDGVRV
jgi:hypothetical protein